MREDSAKIKRRKASLDLNKTDEKDNGSPNPPPLRSPNHVRASVLWSKKGFTRLVMQIKKFVLAKLVCMSPSETVELVEQKFYL